MNFRSINRQKTSLITLAGLFCWISFPATVRAQPCVAPGTVGDNGQAALAPSYLSAWIAKYPTSTLPARMNAQTGRDCNVCHHPPNLSTPGNCYREAIVELTNQGIAIDDAINQLDALDSDGDGVSNGEEALAARPEAGEVGYNPGLIGDFGTDPCGTNPAASVTGVSETPAGAPVPATSTWGVVGLMLLLAICASLVLRERAIG